METFGLPPLELFPEATRKDIFFDANNEPILEPNAHGKIRYPGT
jgi:hypothetical protein